MHCLRDFINLMKPKSQTALTVAKTDYKHGIKSSLGMWGSKLLGLKRNYNSWKGTPNYMKTTFKQHVEISIASLMLKIQCGTKDHGTCGLPMAIEIPLFFFHQKASNRKQRNLIKGLCDEIGVWHEDDHTMEEIVLDYFSSIFQTNGPIDTSTIIDVV